MLLTNRPDGSLLIECGGRDFTRAWQEALQHEKVLMADGRPAIRRETGLGVTWTTVHAHAWNVLKTLPRNRPMIRGKMRLCSWCGAELKLSREFEEVWTWVCPACKATEIMGKNLVGGTRGGGEKEKR